MGKQARVSKIFESSRGFEPNASFASVPTRSRPKGAKITPKAKTAKITNSKDKGTKGAKITPKTKTAEITITKDKGRLPKGPTVEMMKCSKTFADKKQISKAFQGWKDLHYEFQKRLLVWRFPS